MSAPLPYHLCQLARLCRAYPAAPKVVFVPTRGAGEQIGEALARAGVPWLHLHLTTPTAWARRLAEPALDADGWTPLNPDAHLLHLEDLAGSSDADLPLPAHSLAAPAARTLAALRLNHTDPTPAVTDTPRHRLLARLAEAVPDFLRRRRIYDDAFLLRYALRLLAERPGAAAGHVFAVFDEVETPDLTRAFLHRLAEASGQPLLRIGRPAYGIAPPPTGAAVRLADVALAPGLAVDSVGAGGRLWDDDGFEAGSGRIDTVEALGAQNEIAAVVRRLQQEGLAWDQAEIAFTDARYLPLLYALAVRHGLPATFGGGLPATLTGPGQALRGFYAWMAAGLDAADLIGLLDARILDMHPELPPHRAATLLRRARVGRGRARYAPALGRLDDDLRAEHERTSRPDRKTALETEREELRLLTKATDDLLALTPADETLTATRFVDHTVAFLDRFATRRPGSTVREPGRTALDDEAVETLVARLRGAASSVEGERPLAQWLRAFTALLDRHRVGAAAPRPGHLHVAPLRDAGYAGRARLFVVGLDQHAFPGRGTEDPLLLDDERRSLSDVLPLARHAAGTQNWHLVRLLGMTTGHATLLACRRALTDDRARYPSAAFLRARTLLGGHAPELSLLPDPPDATPDACARATLDDTEAGLLLRNDASFRTLHLGRHPWLQRGREALVRRSGARWTAHDGLLDAPHGELDVRRGPVSAGRLETLTACPYRYFLRHELEARPADAPPDEEDDGWLDPLAFGSLLHDLFERFMREVASGDEPVSAERHTPRIEALLEDLIEEVRTHTPPPEPAAFGRDVRRLRAAARIFLRAETGRRGRPHDFEVGFAPVPLRLSPTLTLHVRGRIDRVDAHDDGSLDVWDYKTGSARGYDAPDLLQAGRLQWALYAHALARLTGRPVRLSGYFFPTDREFGRRVAQPPPDPAALARLLEPVLDLTRAACFPQHPSEETCTYCDFQRVCGDFRERRPQIEAKLEADAETTHASLLQTWWSCLHP